MPVLRGMKTLTQIVILSLLLVPNVFAKRPAPPAISSIRTDTAMISVPHFPEGFRKQNGGFVEARDPKTKELLWRVQIYETVYEDELEKDVQDIFIKSITLKKSHNLLILIDEIERVFVLNLESKAVTRVV